MQDMWENTYGRRAGRGRAKDDEVEDVSLTGEAVISLAMVNEENLEGGWGEEKIGGGGRETGEGETGKLGIAEWRNGGGLGG